MASTENRKLRKKIYCDICSTFISSEHELPQHNNGKKHQRLLQLKHERQEDAERSIYVRGFSKIPTLEKDLRKYFSNYGKVSSIFVDKEKTEYAIVSFDCVGSRDRILSSTSLPLFHEKRLIIKPRSMKDTSKQEPASSHDKKKPNEKYLFQQDVIDKIEQAKTIEEKTKLLFSTTCLTQADLYLRKLIVEYLQEIFIEVFPACSINLFGSSSTGLGLKGSDLDLTLLVNPSLIDKEIEELGETCEMSSALKQLEFIAQFLKQFAAGFRNIICVPSMKCPLVKFVHRESGLSCDLSINNRLAIRNTELIKSYLSLDDRVQSLALIIKNWGKAKNLTGSGGRQISNYCLILMLIHYLQRTDPPVLPYLQNMDDKNEDRMIEDTIIDEWHCNFDQTNFMKTNQQTLGDLLCGWFYYFGETFNFVEEIITIRHGSLYKNMNDQLRFQNKQPFTVSPLSVQDPFELNHNLTHNLSLDFAERLKLCCVHTLSLFKSDKMETSQVDCDFHNFHELFSKTTDSSPKSKKHMYSFSVSLSALTTQPLDINTIGLQINRVNKTVSDILSQDLAIICEAQSVESEINPNKCLMDDLNNTVDSGIQNMGVSGDETTAVSPLINGKRPRDDIDTEENIKRRKLCEEERELLLFCKAFHLTWQNRRRQRRIQTHHTSTNTSNISVTQSMEDTKNKQLSRQQEEKMDVGEIEEEEKSDKMETSFEKDSQHITENQIPLIEFKVKVAKASEESCVITLCHIKGSLQDFGNLYAFFKKQVVSKLSPV